MLDSVPLPDQAKKPPPPAARRVQEAAVAARDDAIQGQRRTGRAARGVRPGGPAEKGLAQMSRGDRGGPAPSPDEAAAGRAAHPPLHAGRQGHVFDLRRHLAGQPAHRRRHREPAPARRIDKPAADRGAARYLRLDERLHAAVPAVPACVTDARKRARCSMFGTRLTNVTRKPAGTPIRTSAWRPARGGSRTVRRHRIATSLHTFNKLWGAGGPRRDRAVDSDGLERGSTSA